MIRHSLWRALIVGMLTLVVATGIVPSASATSYRITLVQIECLDKQDSVANGKDEPYIEINGNRVWSGSGFTDGTSANSLGTFLIANNSNVRLWEEDNWPDAD